MCHRLLGPSTAMSKRFIYRPEAQPTTQVVPSQPSGIHSLGAAIANWIHRMLSPTAPCPPTPGRNKKSAMGKRNDLNATSDRPLCFLEVTSSPSGGTPTTHSPPLLSLGLSASPVVIEVQRVSSFSTPQQVRPLLE